MAKMGLVHIVITVANHKYPSRLNNLIMVGKRVGGERRDGVV